MLLAADPGPGASLQGDEALQPFSFGARAEPERVRLGEPFSYQIVIRHPLSQRYDLRPPSNEGPFELLGQTRNRLDDKSGATTTFVLKLALFDLGQNKLPDLTFEIIDADRSGKLLVPGIAVRATSSLPSGAERGEELRDIKPPEDVPIRSYRLLWALAAAAAVVLLGYAAYRAIKQRRLRPAVQPPPAPLDVRTFAALEALRRENLPAQGRAREFYFRLSEIARAYLGARYGFEALECTSAELLQAARKLKPLGLPAEELERFVAAADLVKFAKAPASTAQCEEAFQFTLQLVRRTLPPTSVDLTNAVGAGAQSSHVHQLRLS